MVAMRLLSALATAPFYAVVIFPNSAPSSLPELLPAARAPSGRSQERRQVFPAYRQWPRSPRARAFPRSCGRCLHGRPAPLARCLWHDAIFVDSRRRSLANSCKEIAASPNIVPPNILGIRTESENWVANAQRFGAEPPSAWPERRKGVEPKTRLCGDTDLRLSGQADTSFRAASGTKKAPPE